MCVGDVAYYKQEGILQAGQVLLHVSVNSVAYTLMSAWQMVGGCDAMASASSTFIDTEKLELLHADQIETAVV